MGRLVAQIPNEDPARLARVQDAKWRTIGVRYRLLSAGTCQVTLGDVTGCASPVNSVIEVVHACAGGL